MTIADMRTLEVEVDVSESNVSKIGVGQDVVVRLDAFVMRYFWKSGANGSHHRQIESYSMIKVGFLQ